MCIVKSKTGSFMNSYCVLPKTILFIVVLLLNILAHSSKAVIQYNTSNEGPRNMKTLLDILPLLRGPHCVSVISRNEEILSDIIILISKGYKSVVLQSLYTLLMEMCDTVFIIEMDVSINCSVVFSKVSKASVYIINSELTPTDVTQLEQCVANIPSPEVISVSLLDGSVFALSPVFPSPRRFVKSSVALVIHRQTHPEKIDLAGAIITAVAINDPPSTIIKNKTNKEEIDGLVVMLFKELAQQLNFTISYHTYKNWGVLLSNGTWISGMGEALQEGKAEVVVNYVWEVPSAIYLVDFGPPLDRNEIRFLVRRPKKMDFNWYTFFTLMEPTVWLATMAAFIIVVIVYWFEIKLDHPHIKSWAESILTVFGHFIMTSSHRANSRNTTYILTSWSSFSLLLSVYYTSIIVTRFTLPMFTPRVNTVRQLVEENYYWTVQFYSELTTAEFKESIFDFENKWHYEFEKTYRYIESEEVETRAGSDEKLTFLSDTYGNDIVALTTDGLNGIETVKMYRVAREVISRNYVSFGVKKNSPLLEPLTLYAQRYLEVGLIKIWMDQLLRRRPIYDTKNLFSEQDNPTFTEAQQLRLQKILPFFYLLLLGLSISTLGFLIELIY